MDSMPASKFSGLKKLPVLLGFIALVLIIPLTVFLTLQRQEIRKEAAPGTSLELVAPTEVKVGESFRVDIKLNTGDPSVPTTGTDVVLIYNFVPKDLSRSVIILESSPTPVLGLNVANPASVYCEQIGGRLEIRTGSEGQYGVCIFNDGTECEEWALFRGECQPPLSSAFMVQTITPGNLYDSYPVQEIGTPMFYAGESYPIQQGMKGMIKISGSASNLANYFVGEGLFASFDCLASLPGVLTFEFDWRGVEATDDTNVVGLVDGSPQERLLSQPASLVLEFQPQILKPTPVLMCGQGCSSDADCPEDLVCGTPCPSGQFCAQVLTCYHPDCPFEKDCLCKAASPIPTKPLTLTPTPIPYPTSTPTLKPTPTPTPTPTAPIQLNFNLILEAVRTDFVTEATIYGIETGGRGELQALGSTTTDLSGRGTINLGQEYAGKSYRLFVRTPSHLRKGTGLETAFYLGNNYVDFGTLIAGDLFIAPDQEEQDNLVNNFDVAEVLKEWNMALVPARPDVLRADLNRDGVVNSWDLRMVFDNFNLQGDDLMGPTTTSSGGGSSSEGVLKKMPP